MITVYLDDTQLKRLMARDGAGEEDAKADRRRWALMGGDCSANTAHRHRRLHSTLITRPALSMEKSLALNLPCRQLGYAGELARSDGLMSRLKARSWGQV